MTIEKYSLLKIPANKPVRMKTLEYHYFTCPSEITDEGNDPPQQLHKIIERKVHEELQNV
jgi:hypothetical protein